MTPIKLDLEEDLEVDEKLLKASRLGGFILATTDSELVRRAREIGVPTLSVGRGLKIRLEGLVP
ncbi:MAG: hypothetical protein B6U65_05085 [Candidatus Wolframiiraptor sp. EX4484-121]|nr:MAG: hypothetical protein B6U65_05085 [Candidatus Wolframiiraptor sp. EX4484-121]